MHITKDNLETLGLEFEEYEKQGTTKLAGPLDPPLTVETVTGLHHVSDDRVYIGIDSDGFPYPVAEGIVEASYVLASNVEVAEQRQEEGGKEGPPTEPEDDITGHEVEVYKDESGEFRWRRQAGNNKVVGRSEEGYVDHDYAMERAAALNPGVPINDLTEVEQTHPLP